MGEKNIKWKARSDSFVSIKSIFVIITIIIVLVYDRGSNKLEVVN